MMPRLWRQTDSLPEEEKKAEHQEKEWTFPRYKCGKSIYETVLKNLTTLPDAKNEILLRRDTRKYPR